MTSQVKINYIYKDNIPLSCEVHISYTTRLIMYLTPMWRKISRDQILLRHRCSVASEGFTAKLLRRSSIHILTIIVADSSRL